MDESPQEKEKKKLKVSKKKTQLRLNNLESVLPLC